MLRPVNAINIVETERLVCIFGRGAIRAPRFCNKLCRTILAILTTAIRDNLAVKRHSFRLPSLSFSLFRLPALPLFLLLPFTSPSSPPPFFYSVFVRAAPSRIYEDHALNILGGRFTVGQTRNSAGDSAIYCTIHLNPLTLAEVTSNT